MTLFGRVITSLGCLFILSALAYSVVTASRETLMSVVAAGVVVALFLTLYFVKGWWEERRQLFVGESRAPFLDLRGNRRWVKRLGYHRH